MGEIPSSLLRTSLLKRVDAVDCLIGSGFSVLVAGVWLEFGIGLALIVSGLALMGLGVFAMRG